MTKPHGNELVHRFAKESELEKLNEKVKTLRKITINERFITDCEMIANGGFSPLKGFMNSEELNSVLKNMRLLNGLLWSIPVILPIDEKEFETVEILDEIVLQDENEKPIAIITVDEKFQFNIKEFCKNVFGTYDENHPGVNFTQKFGNYCISGEITVLNTPNRENIDESYYLSPKETREMFEKNNWNTIVAFQTRNPIHRAHEYLIKCALESMDGVLIHPLVGTTKADDIPADVRMKCYEVLIENYFDSNSTALSVLPAAMRYAGPKEAIHHMIIRKNYGCSHMIVGRDHAGVGDYYGTYEAQELVDKYRDELGIQAVKFEHSFYCKKCENLASSKTCPCTKEHHVHLSGTKVREMLKQGMSPPREFSRKEVADILINWATQK